MAASAHFDPPHLDWEAPDMYQEFCRFKQHVEFVFKGPLTSAKDKDRAGWLGIWVGKQGREIYKTFVWEEGDTDKPNKILDKFEEYVRPRKNKRAARFKVKQRKQGESESFDNFLKDLRLIIMDCEYTDPDDVLIDAIIAGVRHVKVQERLLDQGSDLTLANALSIGRQYENSQLQLKLIRVVEDQASAHQVSHVYAAQKIYKQKPHHTNKKHKKQPYKQRTRTETCRTRTQTCSRCGLDPVEGHAKSGQCPAIGSTCKYCHRKDHWIAACRKRTKGVNTLQETDSETHSSDEDVLHIYSAQDNSMANDKWVVKATINSKPVRFRIDTGAKSSIIVKSVFDSLGSHAQTQKSTKVLKSYTNHRIRPLCSVNLPIKHKGKVVNTQFEIVELEQENIISGDVAETLNLIERIQKLDNSSDTQPESKFKDFPELIRTSGTLPGEHNIEIDPDAVGVIHEPRRQPASLKPRIIRKLKEMEQNGYITKVENPTEWVSSMVVSLRNDKIRICLDPSDLNKVVKRAHHPMKTVEDIVSNIPNARVFSKLDAKSGFLQIKLNEKSSYLTTFNTPIGRYRWLRLPFGIKSAPEIFQHIMDQMLEGVEGAAAVMDDILIGGRDVEHHDQILRKVIERATKYNLKLNYDNCEIRQPQVSYVGHLITENGIKPDPTKDRALVDMPRPKDKDGVRCFLGLVQYLAKLIPNLSQVDAPLRILVKSETDFAWHHEQEKCFNELKRLCSRQPVLAFYDVNKPVEIQCDAVLIKAERPVAYSSRSLTDTEKRYAQIEKEMLSIVHAETKFHCYIFGKETVVYNDHDLPETISICTNEIAENAAEVAVV
uniref:Uncharacterized protein K02A2.6-like n=1 Tax=Crassostrea virginica TaxID=6565 RepID=A0A8B8C6S3_CRAVI|nr:uncharacterized protein K02A2.6-like [Crassostrea virginica]